jgi:hypothetical protein
MVIEGEIYPTYCKDKFKHFIPVSTSVAKSSESSERIGASTSGNAQRYTWDMGPLRSHSRAHKSHAQPGYSGAESASSNSLRKLQYVQL